METLKTTFISHRSLFDLCNSPASFQRVMDIVLGDVEFNYAMASMDDVVVYSESLEVHLTYITIALQRMQAADITNNPHKLQLVSGKIILLGFTIDYGTARPDEKKLQAILQLPPPTDVRSLQVFLGMVVFYRHFIPNCADLARPLHELLRKGTRRAWTDLFAELNSGAVKVNR